MPEAFKGPYKLTPFKAILMGSLVFSSLGVIGRSVDRVIHDEFPFDRTGVEWLIADVGALVITNTILESRQQG